MQHRHRFIAGVAHRLPQPSGPFNRGGLMLSLVCDEICKLVEVCATGTQEVLESQQRLICMAKAGGIAGIQP